MKKVTSETSRCRRRESPREGLRGHEIPADDPIENYVLGNSEQEQERLKVQGSFLEQWTEQFLLSAGLEPGMSVLDLGCGMDDVSLLAARLVGASGHVTAIDRDLVIIEKARERSRDEELGPNIEFIPVSIRSQNLFFFSSVVFLGPVARET